MQSISSVLDITTVSDYKWKNADASRTQDMCHVIYIFFGSDLVKA